MQKISSYLYPNRIVLLADLAGFPVEWTNVYQRTIKLYKGISNTIEFDIKNADQKRLDLSTTVDQLLMNVMDANGNALPNSPYDIQILDQTTKKGLATVVIPQDDLTDVSTQFLRYSVVGVKGTDDILFYADSKFGAVGTIDVVGSATPITRPSRIFDTFTAEIDLKGYPTWHSSAIPVVFYEATKTEQVNFDIDLTGFIGSIWIEATKKSTINVEAFKSSDYLWSATYSVSAPGNTPPSIPPISVGDYQYMRVSYTTPTSNGIGASFSVTLDNNSYVASLRAGGTGYAVGSQLKVLGSVLGGVDGINDMIISVTSVEAGGGQNSSSYAISSITTFTVSGTAADGNGTYIVTGTNITGKVDKIVVS